MPDKVSDDDWNRTVAAFHAAQAPTPGQVQMREPSFIDSLPEYNGPFGMFGPMKRMVNGYFPGMSEPATWSPRYMGGAPPGAVAAGVTPPEPPPAGGAPPPPQGGAPPPADGSAAGRVGAAMTSSLRMPTSSDAVLQEMDALAPYLTRPAAIGNVNQSMTDAGLRVVNNANQATTKAKRDEANVMSAGHVALGDIAAQRANLQDAAGDEDAGIYDAERNAYNEVRKQRDQDAKWLRENSKIDPYRKFTTNAGAGILALLGTGLMATGASMRHDGSLEWTKQVDSMLDHEAESQMKLVNNKKWSVTEAGQNMQRLIDTSKDAFEARMRFRNQKLGALVDRAEAIKNSTESEAVKARAEEFIAETNRKIGQNMMDIGIRREGLRSQEAQANLAAGVQTRGQDLALAGQLHGNETQLTNAQRAADAARYKPIRDQAIELDKDYANARTAAQTFYNALRDKKTSSEQLNSYASAFIEAQNKFMSGSGGTAGVRDEVRTFGFPTSAKELLAKANRQYNAQDVAQAMMRLEQAHHDKKDFLYNGVWSTPTPPANSVYSSGR